MVTDKNRGARAYLGLLAGLALAAGVFSAQGLVSAVEGPRFHVVRPGDTLSTISEAYGAPLDQLVALNEIKDPDFIVVGQRLRLPDPSRSTPSTGRPGGREYVVQPGDTLEGIAASQGVSVQALVEANALPDPHFILAGQKLVIPAGGVQPTAGTSASRGSPGSSPVETRAQSSAAARLGSSEVEALLERASARHGVDPSLTKALAWYVSFWRSDAVGPAGSLGPMQVKPDTLEWIGQLVVGRSLNPASVEDVVEGGVAFLAYLLKTLGDERQAVASYIQGPQSVRQNGILPRTEKALEEIFRLRKNYGASGQPAQAGAEADTRRSGGTPAPPTSQGPLEQRVLAAIEATGWKEARVGVAAHNLATGEWVRVRSTEPFRAASLLKVPIMVELYRQLAAERLSMPDHLRSLLVPMITVSDNQAANQLLEIVGKDNVNQTMARLGLKNTVLNNPFSDGSTSSGSNPNQTTPMDMLTLFELLATDKLVTPEASRQMRDLLMQNRDNSKLKRDLPAEAIVAHKSGWFSGVSNDAGIVSTPRGSYVVAIMAEGPFDTDGGNRLVGAVSRAIYDVWGR